MFACNVATPFAHQWYAHQPDVRSGGFPPKKHLDAFNYIKRENFHITIHAGEAFGTESIWQAIQWCGADRIGHATRLIEDIAVDEHEPNRQAAGYSIFGWVKNY